MTEGMPTSKEGPAQDMQLLLEATVGRAGSVHGTQGVFITIPTDNSGTSQFSSASFLAIKEENLVFCASSLAYY